ncbi:hypothetical protein KFK09_004368 [Dendrobium nobile]|uniref:Uncharacterized protein n=1 Tax=Dendrobium nobile TaxID=94219 RepID=A0A8T3C5Z9_DENNO|nr:hypothetical protein KFK09_004368 [Dendrobium nobile]
MFVAKKEHIFGKKIYCTKAQFSDKGQVHDILIECDTIGLKDPCLEIRIDKKRVMMVKRLYGNLEETRQFSLMGCLLRCSGMCTTGFDASMGSAVFMFQTSISTEKSLQWGSSQMLAEPQLRRLSFSLIFVCLED